MSIANTLQAGVLLIIVVSLRVSGFLPESQQARKHTHLCMDQQPERNLLPTVTQQPALLLTKCPGLSQGSAQCTYNNACFSLSAIWLGFLCKFGMSI